LSLREGWHVGYVPVYNHYVREHDCIRIRWCSASGAFTTLWVDLYSTRFLTWMQEVDRLEVACVTHGSAE
jgi:hypothetical protein